MQNFALLIILPFQKMTWQEAKEYCNSKNMPLAILKTSSLLKETAGALYKTGLFSEKSKKEYFAPQ
jgi:hypothetical protein